MLNPDAKPGGKTSRRRTASVEGSNANGNGRGPDFKRRGRNRKTGQNILRNGGASTGAAGHHLSHGGPVNGPDSTPSPNGPVHPGPLVDLYPESPSLHHHQYPFGPSGGRMSPTTAGMIHPENHPAFGGYPGQQEWAPGDYQCGTMNPYYPGGQNRGYCDSLGSSGTEVDYPGARPMSPTQQQILQQQRNGFPSFNRTSFPSPSTPSNGGGNENFHPSFHADKLPNHSLAEASTFPSIQQVSFYTTFSILTIRNSRSTYNRLCPPRRIVEPPTRVCPLQEEGVETSETIVEEEAVVQDPGPSPVPMPTDLAVQTTNLPFPPTICHPSSSFHLKDSLHSNSSSLQCSLSNLPMP